MNHETVMKYWKGKSDIARWKRFGLMTSKQAGDALKELEKTKGLVKKKGNYQKLTLTLRRAWRKGGALP